MSWWDDVGFILNGRRVIAWWQHPRYVHGCTIDDQSWVEAGPGPQDDWLFDGEKTNHKRIGRSRKKIVSYTSRQPSAAQDAHYKRLRSISEHLTTEGIDLDAQYILEARRLLLGQTTLKAEFPGYRYDKTEWLKEQEVAAK